MLLAKMHMSSTALSEEFLFCQSESFLRLPCGGPHLVPLLATDPVAAKEYEKTAAVVEQAPWGLQRAASYLRKLAAEPGEPMPPAMSWLWEHRPVGPLWPRSISAGDFQGLGETRPPAALKWKTAGLRAARGGAPLRVAWPPLRLVPRSPPRRGRRRPEYLRR